MTQNQIAYWANQETERSNKAKETETNRHNVVTEKETQRHNTKTETTDRINANANAVKAGAEVAKAVSGIVKII